MSKVCQPLGCKTSIIIIIIQGLLLELQYIGLLRDYHSMQVTVNQWGTKILEITFYSVRDQSNLGFFLLVASS